LSSDFPGLELKLKNLSTSGWLGDQAVLSDKLLKDLSSPLADFKLFFLFFLLHIDFLFTPFPS